jgi:glycosyltransferase involved in cell wall biosynthesis
VSIEAAKWAAVFEELGFDVLTVAGEGPVDRVVEGLAIDDQRTPHVADVRRAFGAADLVVAENICSLPLNIAATETVSTALAGRPALLHHHDLPWQRARFADRTDLPTDDPLWAHAATTDLSAAALARRRGICATVVHNAFDVDALGGSRDRARLAMGIAADERLLLQPTRALPRKNVPGGVALAEAVGATYWLTGAAEEDYGPELARVLAGARTRTIHGNPGLDPADVYAAADAVVLPSTWEGFGNPAIESAVYRRPLAIGDYPVAEELRAFGFEWFPVDDPAPLARWLDHPDGELIRTNHDVARRHFSLARLRRRLRHLLDERGWLP